MFAWTLDWPTDMSESLVPLAVALIAVTLLMSSLRRRQRSRAAQPVRETPLREPPEVKPPRDKFRRDMDNLLVELQELSRRISAEIDVRFSRLEKVIADADRRIAVLHRLSRDAKDGVEQLAKPMSTRPADRSVEADPRHKIVYDLADAGQSPLEIARDLGKTPGEVEVILNLRRRKAKTSNGSGN